MIATPSKRLLMSLLAVMGGSALPAGAIRPEITTNAPQLEPYVESIAGTVVRFEMIPVAGAAVPTATPADAAGAAAGAATADEGVAVAPFWIGRTEVTWDAYDVWMLGLDHEPAERRRIDAESRPSRPYGAPDRGFGHSGYAAISVTHHAATHYARWLAEKTGRSYRLPTSAEWRHACRAGAGPAPLDAAYLREHSWFADNAARTTHPVGTKQPDGLGLFDMLGNAGEWASGPGGEPVLHGGTYRDAAGGLGCDAIAAQAAAWNATDPQVPKSTWWLSDGPFAGFRVVRDGVDANVARRASDAAVYLRPGVRENRSP